MLVSEKLLIFCQSVFAEFLCRPCHFFQTEGYRVSPKVCVSSIIVCFKFLIRCSKIQRRTTSFRHILQGWLHPLTLRFPGHIPEPLFVAKRECHRVERCHSLVAYYRALPGSPVKDCPTGYPVSVLFLDIIACFTDRQLRCYGSRSKKTGGLQCYEKCCFQSVCDKFRKIYGV